MIFDRLWDLLWSVVWACFIYWILDNQGAPGWAAFGFAVVAGMLWDVLWGKR